MKGCDTRVSKSVALQLQNEASEGALTASWSVILITPGAEGSSIAESTILPIIIK
jgi:hypothetical protein